jgi:hypothetical protein
MKTAIILVLSCIMATMFMGEGITGKEDSLKPKAYEVAIYFSGVEIPLNRILLIRKDTHYCAVKFTRCWTEIDEERMKEYGTRMDRGGDIADILKDAARKKYAIYEAYYQGDATGNFANKNVKISQGKASWLPLRGPFRPFIYQPGDAHVECGPFKLGWEYKTGVSFIPSGKGMGDFGFELAPTPWTDISQVNVFDPRVKWYRYDEKRERIFIHIDRLWENKGK